MKKLNKEFLMKNIIETKNANFLSEIQMRDKLR